MGQTQFNCCKEGLNSSFSDVQLENDKKKKGNATRPLNTDVDKKILTDITDHNFSYVRGAGNHEFMQNHLRESNLTLRNDDTNFTTRIKQLKDIVENAPSLILEVIGTNSTIQKRLKINAQGLENTLRNEQDGVTYFGYNSPEDPLICDYVLKKNESNDSIANAIGRHFQIFFDIDCFRYFIRDLRLGSGTFKKITSETVLFNNCLLNIGETYIVVSFLNEDNENEYIGTQENNNPLSNNIINFKIFSSNEDEQYDPLNFQPSKSAIRVGRSSECEVFINDSLLSRFQCMIEYDSTVGWTIRDGSAHKNDLKGVEYKPSTNGTWMFLNDDFQIYDGMIFKNGKTIFECRFSGERADQ